MNRIGIDHLRWVRQLVAQATTRVDALSAGAAHPDLDMARTRLAHADRTIVRALGQLPYWVRTGITVADIWLATWVFAALAHQVLGLGTGWTIAVAIVPAIVAYGLTYKVHNVAGRFVGRRRARWEDGVADTPDLLALLKRARAELAKAAAAQEHSRLAGRPARTVAWYLWSRANDRTLFFISAADRSLCEVMAAVDHWLVASGEAS